MGGVVTIVLIIYIAVFVFEFCDSILTKQNTLYWNLDNVSLFSYNFFDVSSIITPFPKTFVVKVVILQLESVRSQQRHNPLG